MLDAGPLSAVIIQETGEAIARRDPANTFTTDARSTLLIGVAGRARAPDLLAHMVDAMFRITFSTGSARFAVGLGNLADVIDAAM